MATKDLEQSPAGLHVKGNNNIVIHTTASTIRMGSPSKTAERHALSDKSNISVDRKRDQPTRILIIGNGLQDIIKKVKISEAAEEKIQHYEHSHSELTVYKDMHLVPIVFPHTLSGKADTTCMIMKTCAKLKPGPHIVLFPIALSDDFDQDKAKKVKLEFRNMRKALGNDIQIHTYVAFTDVGSEVEVKKCIDKFPDLALVVNTYCKKRAICVDASKFADTMNEIAIKKSEQGSSWYGIGPFETMKDIIDSVNCGKESQQCHSTVHASAGEENSGDKMNKVDSAILTTCTPTKHHTFKDIKTPRKAKKRHRRDRQQLEFTKIKSRGKITTTETAGMESATPK